MTGKGPSPNLLAAALLTVAVATSANEPEPVLLAEMCAACHGPDGRSPGPIPGLDSLNEEAMRVVLLAFRSGEVEATVMDRIARALTDADVRSLARHFGSRAE